jgi:hypothetical protein
VSTEDKAILCAQTCFKRRRCGLLPKADRGFELHSEFGDNDVMTRNVHVGFTLLAYLLSGGIGGSGTLCIGADGHVEIESSNADCCSSETGTPPANDDPCGACLDIPLLNEHISSTGIKTQINSTGGFQSSVPATSGSTMPFMKPSVIARERHPIASGEISSAYLQCTVLLC